MINLEKQESQPKHIKDTFLLEIQKMGSRLDDIMSELENDDRFKSVSKLLNDVRISMDTVKNDLYHLSLNFRSLIWHSLEFKSTKEDD